MAGKTSYNSSNPSEISIEINTSMALTRPSLGVIKTILHELIHADMMRKIYTSNPNQVDTDFYNTYNYFKDNLFQATAQHETMASLYVDNLKKALKDYHQLILFQDYNYLTNNGANPLPDDFYEAMAWRGLATQNVQAYVNLPQTRKDELDAVLSLYYFSTTSNCP